MYKLCLNIKASKGFQKVEKDGYDGIKINDYAQVESEGNFGHTSIGLFESISTTRPVTDTGND